MATPYLMAHVLHLVIETAETHVGLIIDACEEQNDKNKIKKVKHIENAVFYVAKFVKDGRAIYGIKKTPSEWKNINRRNFFSVHFTGEELEVEDSDTFSLPKNPHKSTFVSFE